MNPLLSKLQPYPFEKLRQLFGGVTPNPDFSAISLGIGEPKHPTPTFIQQALAENLSGLATYPTTAGTDQVRQAICNWLERRYELLSHVGFRDIGGPIDWVLGQGDNSPSGLVRPALTP